MTSATFTERIYEHVHKHKDELALIDDRANRRLTYAELRRLTGAVGSALKKRGFGPGHFLTHFASNCVENIPIAHGTMATGGTVHLMKPNATRAELLFHVRMVRPRFLVATADCADKAVSVAKEADTGVETVFVIGPPPAGCLSAEELLGDAGDEDPIGRVKVDAQNDVAALMQTGGTTGFSKTVMATHAALSFYFGEVQLALATDATSVALTFVPFSYINGFLGSFGVSLHNGSAVVMMREFDADELLRLIDVYDVTDAVLSPATATDLVHAQRFRKASLRSLRKVTWGGAPIPKELEEMVIERFEEKNKQVTFQQAYGATESLVITQCVPEVRKLPGKAGSVGKLIDSVEAKVVSCIDDSVECKAGEAGHVLVKSPTMMKGYFKNEALTQQVLKDGWYYTGDYGWLDEDNSLFVVDRIEHLIINNDSVVVPSHLEAVILLHPKVVDCVVIGRKMDGGQRPMACVVVEEPEMTSAKEIQEFVAARVPPRERLTGGVRFVDKIPKSLAGKLLRSAFKDE